MKGEMRWLVFNRRALGRYTNGVLEKRGGGGVNGRDVENVAEQLMMQ